MARLLTDHADPYQRRYTFPKYNGPTTALHEYRILRLLPEFRTWSRADHVEVARQYAEVARAEWRVYVANVVRAESSYGSHGPLISGIVREHFPEVTKDCLRYLARRHAYHAEVAYAHWRMAGKRTRLAYQ